MRISYIACRLYHWVAGRRITASSSHSRRPGGSQCRTDRSPQICVSSYSLPGCLSQWCRPSTARVFVYPPLLFLLTFPVCRGGGRLHRDEIHPPVSSQLEAANSVPSSQWRGIAGVSLHCRSGGVSGVNYSPPADFMFGGEGGAGLLGVQNHPPPYSLGEVVEL